MRRAVFFGAGFIALMHGAACFAAGGYWDFEAAGKTNAVNIDGVAGPGEYDAAPLVVNKARVEDTGAHNRCVWGDYRDDADWSARVYAAWDMTYLYLFFDVTDDEMQFRSWSDATWDVPGADSLEFGLDVHGAESGPAEARALCAFLYVSGGDAAKKEPLGHPVLLAHPDWLAGRHAAAQILVASAPAEQGYGVEVAIPWEALSVDDHAFKPRAGCRVGIYPIFFDADKDGPPAHQGVFVTDDTQSAGLDAVNDPPNWVDITLAAPKDGGVVAAPAISKKEAPLRGGDLLRYEVVPLADGNWPGDGYTWGGLDRMASLDADRAALWVQGPGQSAETRVVLTTDLSSCDVRVSVGIRRNPNMASACSVYWDGELLLQCNPCEPGERLEPEVVHCKQGRYDFRAGTHVVRAVIDGTDDRSGDSFQVDAVALEEEPSPPHELLLPVGGLELVPFEGDAVVKAAAAHFQARLESLADPAAPAAAEPTRVGLVVGRLDDAKGLPVALTEALAEPMRDLEPFQKEEGFVLALDTSAPEHRLYALGLGTMGAVYALSELELRLRLHGNGLALAFPEWSDAGASRVLVEKPAFSMRGEYMNVGYNTPQITPHEWSRERWTRYIDQLVLAKLNRFEFYIWNDSYTMYPGSKRSGTPLNRKLHEDLRFVIDYAHSRGLKISYHICPTYFPGDIWLAHPEYKADIEYTEHGFPAVCPRAEGCWELMKDIWSSEMDWFAAADTVQIWFYDPGGCWCERNGCKEHQVETLVRQVKEFSELFWQRNPGATIECNLWPMWLWEARYKTKYTRDICHGIREALGDKADRVCIIGAPDSKESLPYEGRAEGFDTGVFIFGTNPEAGYNFTVPTLRFCKYWINDMYKQGFNGAFGHRLEAWTRYPGTFAMGQYLWNPEREPNDVARKYAYWQAADAVNGERFAEALLLLDDFTEKGAQADLAARLIDLGRQFFPQLPKTTRESLEYWPAMLNAIEVVAQSKGIDDNPGLTLLAEQFGEALAGSETFASLVPRAKSIFVTYRGLLFTGQRSMRF